MPLEQGGIKSVKREVTTINGGEGGGGDSVNVVFNGLTNILYKYLSVFNIVILTTPL